MENRHKKSMVMIIVLMMGVTSYVQACLTTFINDKGVRVFIYNKNDKVIIPVERNEKRRFGNPHKHAYFAIHMQEPNTRLLSRVYVCKQNECGKRGNIELKLSDIENGTEATKLFTITKEDPYSSMVQNLPMMQKKNCHSCSGE
ncbi:MAG TPA: hypothetical protein VJJ26_01445 [Candidatus Babeliales bacterium]|nr:hypothetical protein [Candidatus Babeliales bacterium]